MERGREGTTRQRQLRRRLILYVAALALLFATALVEVVWEAAHLRLPASEVALNLGVDVLGATALAAVPLWLGTAWRADRVVIVLATALVLWGAWHGLPDALDDTTTTATVAWARALGSLPIAAFNLWLVAPFRERRDPEA